MQHVQPYLFFDGRCDEALAFYKGAVGAKVSTLMCFKDAPQPTQCNPGAENKVMHAPMRIGDTAVLASDRPQRRPTEIRGFVLTINAKDEAEADRLFNALVEGG